MINLSYRFTKYSICCFQKKKHSVKKSCFFFPWHFKITHFGVANCVLDNLYLTAANPQQCICTSWCWMQNHRQVVVILCCQCESYATSMVFIEKCLSFHTPFFDCFREWIVLHFCILLILCVFSSVLCCFFFASSTKCDFFCVCAYPQSRNCWISQL